MELAKFNGICKEVFELRESKKLLEDQVKDINEMIREKEVIIQQYLEENELTRFDSSYGLISQSVKLNVKRTDEEALKKELQIRGDYDSMARLNTQTLTAYIKAEKEKSDDLNFSFPGCEISEFIKLTYRRK